MDAVYEKAVAADAIVTDTLYRGLHSLPAEQMRVGAEIPARPAYQSATVDQSVAESFAGEGESPVILEIENGEGMPLPSDKSEGEVLIQRDTAFEVVGIEQRFEGVNVDTRETDELIRDAELSVSVLRDTPDDGTDDFQDATGGFVTHAQAVASWQAAAAEATTARAELVADAGGRTITTLKVRMKRAPE